MQECNIGRVQYQKITKEHENTRTKLQDYKSTKGQGGNINTDECR